MNMKTRYVFFDFDGTVADTFDTVLYILNELSEKYGFDPIDTKEDREYIRNHSPAEWFMKFDMSPTDLPAIMSDLDIANQEMISEIKVFPGLLEVIGELKSHDIECGIITSNSEDFVLDFLEVHEIDLFDFVYGNRNVFTKHTTIMQAINDYKVDRGEAVYVGDEARDVKAAKEIDVRSVAVTWGFNSKEYLQKSEPDLLVDHVRDLLLLKDFAE